MTSAEPPTGTAEDRQIWQQWAWSSGLADAKGNFHYKACVVRRQIFRNSLEPKDVHLMSVVGSATIKLFHFKNEMTERSPRTIRTLLNSTCIEGTAPGPFESWVGPLGLEKRKQGTRVWSDLLQFMILEYHINNVTWVDDNTLSLFGESGHLSSMGLEPSDDLCDDIMDIVQSHLFGINIKSNALTFYLNIIMQENPTPQNNPLLFWVGLLLQTEEFGTTPRLEFDDLKDQSTMREKLEALVHYARVLILDYAYQSWWTAHSTPEEWSAQVKRTLNAGTTDRYTGTRVSANPEGDPEDFGEASWRSFLEHFEAFRKQWLMKGSNSPIGKILELL